MRPISTALPSAHRTLAKPVSQASSAAIAPSVRPWPATRATPAKTLDEGLARLSALSERFAATGDRRAVFADTYLIQIAAFAEDVATTGRYAHPEWMTAMTLDFLQRYLDAVDAYDRGDRAGVPEAWLKAFDSAKKGDAPVVTDLLLAMNAHINHDLPLSLAATQATSAVQADYVKFNQVLAAHVDAVQQLVSDKFLKPGSLAARGDALAGPLDEAATRALIKNWRAAAWTQGQAIARQGQAAYPAIQKRSAWRASVFQSGSKLLPTFLAKQGLL